MSEMKDPRTAGTGTPPAVRGDERTRQQLFLEELKLYIAQRKQETGRTPSFHITTMGCQMNARDSEKLAGVLTEIGAEETETEEADILLFG